MLSRNASTILDAMTSLERVKEMVDGLNNAHVKDAWTKLTDALVMALPPQYTGNVIEFPRRR